MMIDKAGYRANVGIILINDQRKVLWAQRIRNKNAWQFPQGGVDASETAQEAMYRELKEEIGLDPEHVELLAETRQWLHYKLPKHLMRHHSEPLGIGQKQKWFLLKFLAEDTEVNLNLSEKPEFKGWCWVDYWHPVNNIIYFKRSVYRRALKEFESRVFTEGPLC